MGPTVKLGEYAAPAPEAASGSGVVPAAFMAALRAVAAGVAHAAWSAARSSSKNGWTVLSIHGSFMMSCLSSESRIFKLACAKKRSPVRAGPSAWTGLASGNNTYGSGYRGAKSLVDGNSTLPESYGLLKMTATAVSYVSGIPGGIMAPTLSAGAGFGANIA